MNEYALITGASSGIGRALGRQFAKNGYHIVAVAQKEIKLAEACEEFSLLRPGIEVIALIKDLRQPNAATELYSELTRRNIAISALINNAGIGERGEFWKIPIEEQVDIIHLNIEALTRMTRAFLPSMVARAQGRILNVGSVAGFQPGPLFAVYHASKAYVNSFSEALAEELKDSGVTVTCLCPGATDTAFFARADMTDARVVQKLPLMDPDKVAQEGFEAFQKGERIFIPGMTNKVMTFMRRVMPNHLQAKLNKSFYESAEE